MSTVAHLMRQRRFVPLFVTQLFNAFNDNLYKNAMVLFVVYSVYNSESEEASFSALASGLFILPFFLLSAVAGQLADMRDKAKIIRIVKLCEIGLMIIGASGLYLAWRGVMVETVAIPLTLAALTLTGVQSTFLGPIKYAILPQHLKKDEVLAGTGLVEAGTYIAILAGTILAGWIAVEVAAALIVITAIVGYFVSRQVPDAPPQGALTPIDWNIARASVNLIRNTMHNREVYYAILAISFFWTIGAVLFIQFPPLAKNVIMASKEVASLFLVVFSIGVAIGSVAVNALLKGQVSARYAPVSVLCMGAFVVAFYVIARIWGDGSARKPCSTSAAFLAWPMASAAAARAAWHCDCGGHVRGSALRFPDDPRRAGSGGAHDRGEQHRQFGRYGLRGAALDGVERRECRYHRTDSAERGDVPGFGLAWPETVQGRAQRSRARRRASCVVT